MPNRIIKESICTSPEIDSLSTDAEIFFYRLIVNCDDFGRLDARAPILRARCYPLKIDKVKDKDIDAWLSELSTQGLIQLYEVNGVRYLILISWDKHQSKRAQHSKYPAPDDGEIICNHLNSKGKQMKANVPENRESRNDIRETRIEKVSQVNTFDSDSQEYQLAQFMVARIQDNLPTFKEPNLQKWAIDLDKMLRLDKRTPDEVRRVIAWAQGHTFWKANILSPSSLRKQWDRLVIQMGESKGGQPRETFVPGGATGFRRA